MLLAKVSVGKILKWHHYQNNFDKILTIASDYGLKLNEILSESFEQRVVRKFKNYTREIDKLFDEYDNWEESE